ncbi:glycosyltransferase family 4 protein [Mesorhizobium sp. CAU 1741]|uniref:glycosyltransferase family 4 protein n=1 Tax=Mesorhizobium sp. CAU 1741 TaxID=3140366 RepID=UPI00325AF0C1
MTRGARDGWRTHDAISNGGLSMKLLVLVNHYAPDRGGGGAAYTDLCRGLAQRGIDVTVGCPYPFYPEWRDKSGRNGMRLWRYEEGGVKIVRYGLAIPRDPRALLPRLGFELSLFLSALRLVPEARQADCVMVYCPYFGMVAVGALIRLLYGTPCWLNVQDVMSDAARSTGMVRSPLLSRLMARAERFAFNLYPVWSSISPVMVERLAAMSRGRQEIVLLPNWLDGELRGELEKQEPRTPPATPVRLLYAGNISRKQDLLRLCRFLADSDIDFRFRLFGDGGEAEAVRRWVETAGDARFSFGRFLDAPGLARELRAADFHVVTERSGVGASFFPSKYVGGIAAGTPILAICDRAGPLGREVSRARTGALVEWAELDDLSQILRQAGTDATDWRLWQRNCLLRARHFDRDTLLDDLANRLHRMVSSGTQAATAAAR